MGDWSESGTFLRKPANGWLHDDRDLTNTGITYKIHVCASYVVLMRCQVFMKSLVSWLHRSEEFYENTTVSDKDTSHEVCRRPYVLRATLLYRNVLSLYREAITRLAETAQRITPNKKRKVRLHLTNNRV